MIDVGRSTVKLDVNGTELVVRIVLMPADEHLPFRLDPVETVAPVRVVSAELEPDFYPYCRRGVPFVIEEDSRFRLSDDPIGTLLARFSASSPHGAEL